MSLYAGAASSNGVKLMRRLRSRDRGGVLPGAAPASTLGERTLPADTSRV